MSDLRKLFKQSSHYFIGQVLAMAAGFVSFPILTRVFSVKEYGMLGLIAATILIMTSIIKLGISISATRYFALFKSNNRLSEYYSTIFIGYGSVALSASAIFWLVVQLLPDTLVNADVRKLFSLVAIIILFSGVNAIFISCLRAEQRTKLTNFINVANRYSSFALGIGLVFYLIRGLEGFVIGQIISNGVIAFTLLYFFLRRAKISIKNFSKDFFKESLKFGGYVSGSELGHLLLNHSNRYLIQYYLGSMALGIYTAGYNMTTYVIEMIMLPISYAIDPIYLDIFVNKGEKETKYFLTKVLRYFLLFVFPVIFGFIAVRSDMIELLASQKYLQAEAIIPYVILGNSIYACQVILNAGLIIKRKTQILMTVKLAACVLNIGLNLVLLPKYGIIGAAQATLYSYIFYVILITYWSFKEFSFRIEYRQIFLYMSFSFIMFLIIKNIHFASVIVNILSKVGTGIVIYSVLIIIFDSELRKKLIELMRKLRTVDA